MGSTAASFFELNRKLFEYDKYFPGIDPCLHDTSVAPISHATHAMKNALVQPTTHLSQPFSPQSSAFLRELSQIEGKTIEDRPPMTHQVACYSPPKPRASPVKASLQSVVPKYQYLPISPRKRLPNDLAPKTYHDMAGSPRLLEENTKKESYAKSVFLDSSLRTITRKVDMAQKIEQLVGPKYGRVIGSSSNLPPAVRKRLDAYGRLDQRKELLYQTLTQEYDQLCDLRSRLRG
jgi:hypothetical protein